MTPDRELVERIVRAAVAELRHPPSPAEIDALLVVVARGLAAYRVLLSGARTAPPLPPAPPPPPASRAGHPTLYSMRPVKK